MSPGTPMHHQGVLPLSKSPRTVLVYCDKTDLDYGAELAGVAEEQTYRPSATCATLVAADGTLNLPNDQSLSWTFDNAHICTPASQSMTGDGTIFDPRSITTVAAGESVKPTQVKAYASDASTYSIEMTVCNTAATVLSLTPTESLTALGGAAYTGAGAADNALGKRRYVLSGIEAQLPSGSVPGSSGQPIVNLLAMSWKPILQPCVSSTVSFRRTHPLPETEPCRSL